ncbi:MAG: hypothetical protein A2Y17_06695 [Clostridiales bacterium GWF2_38_85]|nr:MAG: hypothetical protein A2Y17_06695 [Clostridiales bacterium GWF2_38_85]HBL84903.1 DNA alkylation repair protein [Clostridiales bacterium]
MTQAQIREKLKLLTDEKYKVFSAELIPNCTDMLGVRLPELRKIAKEIAKGAWKEYIDTSEYQYFEEKLLAGMVIGYVRADIDTIFEYTDKFLPHIDNWSVCDSFCTTLTIAEAYRPKVWQYILKQLESDSEFKIRFAVIMIQRYFIKKDRLVQIFDILSNIKHSGYYVKMGTSWAICECFCKFPEETINFLREYKTDEFTLKKSLQKILESQIPDTEQKVKIRKLKQTQCL